MEKEIIHPKADGIFVDTEGTLIIDDRLNEGLYETMSLLKQIGEKVIILTGSPLKMTKDRLQEIINNQSTFRINKDSICFRMYNLFFHFTASIVFLKYVAPADQYLLVVGVQ